MEEQTHDLAAGFQRLWDAWPLRRGSVRFDVRLGLVDFGGSEHGTTHVLAVHDVPGLGRVVIVREVGGTHWAGRAERGRHGQSVHSILIDTERRERGWWRFVSLGGADWGRNDDERAAKSRQVIDHLGLGGEYL